MKKKILIFIGLLLMLGVVNSFIYRSFIREFNKDSYKFKKEYESLNNQDNGNGKEYRELNISKNNRIKYSSAKEVLKMMDSNDTFLVYFGFAKCPWCRSMIENLLELADKNEVDIYYVDVFEIRDVKELKDGEVVEIRKGDSNYMKLLDKMNEVLDNYSLTDEDGNKMELNEKRIYAPNVVAVVNGKATKKVEGISEDLKDPYGELTTKMIKDSKEQLKCIFKCLQEAGVCTKPNAC